MTYFDSHCHFDFGVFDEGRESLWQACRSAGVKQLVIPAVSPDQASKQFAVVDQLPGVYGAAGLHPWWVGEWLSAERSTAELEQALSSKLLQPSCVAVGECGLDAMIELPIEQQLPFFQCQLELADRHNLPVIVHVRKAHAEVLQQLKKYRPQAGGVIHGFSGSFEQAQQYWQLGFYIGVGGVVTYERANKTRQAVAQLPAEAIVLETDAPDMPLSGRQGQPNSPLYLPEVAAVVAELRDTRVADIAAQTTENSRRLFQLD